ncbi:mCG141698, isoform CRA_a, partial [Mus musculus]
HSGQACFSWAHSSEDILAASRTTGVLGHRKVGDVRIFFFLWLWMPFSTAFLAFKAFALASALGGAGASFFAFSADF